MTRVTVLLAAVLSLLGWTASAMEVTLGWNANTESNLVGYKIYRGPASGNYTENIDVGMATSTPQGVEYTWTAPDGVKLYYVVTAYGNCTDGPCESGYSNEVYAPAVPGVPQRAVYNE